MSCTISNRAGRIVSFRGNSGQTWHVPPFASIEVMDVEVVKNDKIQKLEAKGIVTLQTERPSGASARGRRGKAQR